MNTELPLRRPNRADWHDYDEGVYFITCCTAGKAHIFGYIDNGRMHRSPLGEVVEAYFASLAARIPDAILDEYIVMPNHVHVLVELCGERPEGSMMPLLARFVKRMKAEISRAARRQGIPFEWQRSYYDHIIRNHSDFDNISEYIRDNVRRWEGGYDTF